MHAFSHHDALAARACAWVRRRAARQLAWRDAELQIHAGPPVAGDWEHPPCRGRGPGANKMGTGWAEVERRQESGRDLNDKGVHL